jgi:hypothetical protein
MRVRGSVGPKGQRRNYSEHATRYYIRTVEDFACYNILQLQSPSLLVGMVHLLGFVKTRAIRPFFSLSNVGPFITNARLPTLVISMARTAVRPDLQSRAI